MANKEKQLVVGNGMNDERGHQINAQSHLVEKQQQLVVGNGMNDEAGHQISDQSHLVEKQQLLVVGNGMNDEAGHQISDQSHLVEKQQLLVVGNGMVGHHFIEQLVAAGGLARFEVTVLGAEPDPAYDRVHLSEVFGGKAPQALRLADPAWYEESGIVLRLGAEVEALDREGRTLTLASTRRS